MVDRVHCAHPPIRRYRDIIDGDGGGGGGGGVVEVMVGILFVFFRS